LRRVVGYLAENGIDQFLDIGSGLLTVGNVHEVAQKINPSARVAYLDVDPIAVRYSEEILRGSSNVAAIQADLRRPEAILDHPELGRLLDLDRPTAVLLLAILLFVTDDEEACRVVGVLRDALAPGSYVAISHPTGDDLPRENIEQVKNLYAAIGSPVSIRSYDRIERFFDGLELVEPGLVYVSDWRPEDLDDPFFDRPGYYGGVGRKP
jgi:hypothetical protein